MDLKGLNPDTDPKWLPADPYRAAPNYMIGIDTPYRLVWWKRLLNFFGAKYRIRSHGAMFMKHPDGKIEVIKKW